MPALCFEAGTRKVALLAFFQNVVQAGDRLLLVHSEEQQSDLMRQLDEHGCDIDAVMLAGRLEVCVRRG